jgi:Transposase DDE domain group 1
MKTEKNQRTGQFGGISFVAAVIEKYQIHSLFENRIGKRAKQAKYQYSDVLLGWIYSNFCGAERLEDIDTLGIFNFFQAVPIAKVSSPDQIGRIFKQLATPTDFHFNKDSGIRHEFNRNETMNDLLLDLCKRLRLLEENYPYLIDFDGTTIPTEKIDTKPTYKGFMGYSPAVSLINQIPVCIEARNGNTPASYKIKEALQELFTRLDKHNIQTWGIRMDAASYQKEVIYYLLSIGKKFFIRVANTDEMKDDFKIAAWQKVEMHGRTEEMASVEFFPFENVNKFRFVITRFDKGTNPKEPDYVYRGIITNEMEKKLQSPEYVLSDFDVVRFYDQRGDSENNFKDLLNDFNWKRVPFSDMNHNLVFLYVSAMAKCLYQFCIEQFSSYSAELKSNYKLKNFNARFIRPVQVQWIKTENGWSFELINYAQQFDKLRQWALKK